MEITTETKTANQLYKESGTSLSFAEWIEREKEKSSTFIKNTLLDDIVPTSPQSTTTEVKENNRFSFGIPKWVLISGVIILASAIAYKSYRK